MKRTILSLTIAALTLGSTGAYAQPGHDRGNGSFNDRDHNGRPDNSEHRDDRGRNGAGRWSQGQRLPSQFFNRNYMVNDYGRYRLGAPPRGYAYYRTDTGDIVMAAIATGIISSVVAGILSDNNQAVVPGYAPYGVDPGYAPAPAYRYDQYGRPY
jgi:Ni/Co efflux regulator RcnB